MKVSDIMLDLETGDASVHDAYVQEAMGQVNVSAAIYDAAKNIASLEPSEMTEVIQEAATNAGLPTDREKAIELMYEAVERELIGTCRHLYQEACIFVEYAEKATSPNKALNMLAKKCGAKVTINPSLEYAKTFAKAVTGGKSSVQLEGERFVTGASAKAAAATVIKAFANLAEGCCISVPDSFYENDSVKAIVPALAKTKSEDGKRSLSYMSGNLGNAADALVNADNKLKKTDSASVNDIAMVMCAWFAVYAVADGIKKSGGVKSEKQISAAVKEQDKKKVSGAAEECNKKCPEVNKKLQAACKTLIGAFGDAFLSLISAVGK